MYIKYAGDIDVFLKESKIGDDVKRMARSKIRDLTIKKRRTAS